MPRTRTLITLVAATVLLSPSGGRAQTTGACQQAYQAEVTAADTAFKAEASGCGGNTRASRAR